MSNNFFHPTKIALLQEAGFLLSPEERIPSPYGCGRTDCDRCFSQLGRTVVGGPGLAAGSSRKAISRAIDAHQGGLLRRSLDLVGRGEHARSQEDWDEAEDLATRTQSKALVVWMEPWFEKVQAELYAALSEEESREHLATERAFGFAPPALWSED